MRNVIDFGAFVDLGVHQDGLVHVSQISDKFIKHPREVLKVGDIVRVKVLNVDTAKKLSLIHISRPVILQAAGSPSRGRFRAPRPCTLCAGRRSCT